MELSDPHLTLLRELLEGFVQESSQLGVCILGKDLRIEYLNRCFSDLLKTDPENPPGYLTAFTGDETAALLQGVDRDIPRVFLSLGTLQGEKRVLHCTIRPRGGFLFIMGVSMNTGDDSIFRQMTLLSNEMMNASRELRRTNRELREANSRIRKLSGIIPICMHCKKIRDDDGYWSNLESFLREHSEAEFSHSICDDCAEKLYSN